MVHNRFQGVFFFSRPTDDLLCLTDIYLVWSVTRSPKSVFLTEPKGFIFCLSCIIYATFPSSGSGCFTFIQLVDRKSILIAPAMGGTDHSDGTFFCNDLPSLVHIIRKCAEFWFAVVRKRNRRRQGQCSSLVAKGWPASWILSLVNSSKHIASQTVVVSNVMNAENLAQTLQTSIDLPHCSMVHRAIIIHYSVNIGVVCIISSFSLYATLESRHTQMCVVCGGHDFFHLWFYPATCASYVSEWLVGPVYILMPSVVVETQ